MFLSVLELAASTNNEGFHHALLKSWSHCGLSLKDAPSKSSLSEARSKVSYHFFEDIYRKDVEQNSCDRKMYRGHYVYAVDGDQFDIPATSDVLKNNYRGYPTSKNRETHYPKMYTSQVLDVLNDTVQEFSFSTTQDEVYLARELVPSFENNSITLYDRLYCGYETIRSHAEAGNYFLVRARTGRKGERGQGVHTDVAKFCDSNRTDSQMVWRPQPGFRRKHPDFEVRLVKIKHPKTKQQYVFITNLPADKFKREEVGLLYRRRWEIETSFKDITCTLKLGQWHSKTLNGILQEIYALLWLVNATRRQMQAALEKPKELLKQSYKKTNFKLTAKCILENIGLLVRCQYKKFLKIIGAWMIRMLERRTRDSRSYERVIKHRGREYPNRNAIPRRKKPLTERH